MTQRAAARTDRRDRTDMLRNRGLLLDAARATYAELGADASLKSIAARAGLGVGTVYRHFPTQEALIEAVLADHFTALHAMAGKLARSPEPDRALAAWLREFVTQLTQYRGLARTVMPQLQDQTSHLYHSCHQMRSAAADLLTNAQQAGTIREDIDILGLLNLANAVALAVEQRPEHAPLTLSVLMDGLRPPQRSPGSAHR